MKLDPKTPVLVGAKTITQRLDDALEAKGTSELMVDAALEAISDTSVDNRKDLLANLGEVISMRSMTKMENPAYIVAQKIGAKNTKTVLADVGVLQQGVFNRAMENIMDGSAKAVLVLGGETQYRHLRARIAGIEIPELNGSPNDSAKVPAPDTVLEPGAGIIHQMEVDMKLFSAASHYAMLENAFGHAKGLTPSAQRKATAQLWESFNKVAAKNPLAAFAESKSAEEIATPGSKNRPIAAPYNKWNCSQVNVDQASALVFTSAELAQQLNIPKEKWVFPYVGAISDNMVPVVQRDELHRSQGFNIISQSALASISTETQNITIDDITYLDLYSCFPVAVWLQTQELGIDIDRQLTITGGMTFGGGPLNSYVLGSLVRMVEVLREDPKATGLATSISGMVTKQGLGIWSCEPRLELPPILDLTSKVAQATTVRDVDSNYGREQGGGATVVSSTLLYDKEANPERAVCIADTPDNSRTMAFSTDPEVLELLDGEDYLGNIIGSSIHISSTNEFQIS